MQGNKEVVVTEVAVYKMEFTAEEFEHLFKLLGQNRNGDGPNHKMYLAFKSISEGWNSFDPPPYKLPRG